MVGVAMAASPTNSPAKARDAVAGASDTGIPAMFVRRDTPTAETPAVGDYVIPQVNANGEQYVQIVAGANSQSKAQDVASGASDVGVPALMVRRDAPAAITPIAGDYAFATLSANGEQWVRDAVDLADDAAAILGTSRTKLIAGVSVNMDGTDPLAVSAEGDTAAMRTDPNRIQLVNQTHPRYFRASVDYASAQTNASVVTAPGAGLSLWITDIVISNGATAGNITLLDGSGGSVVFEVYPAINGGVAHSFRNPIKLTANTALCITSTTVTTHAVNVTGYIAA